MVDGSQSIINRIRNGLIVSCQAPAGEPLHGSEIMARMAKAAEIGGAAGIRANSPQDIRAIRSLVSLPVIGIYKKEYPGSSVYITPTFTEFAEVAEASAEIIAVDGTLRPRPGGETLQGLVNLARARYPQVLLMADVSTHEEGVAAAEVGFDIVATTLAGYTEYTRGEGDIPDFNLVESLAHVVKVPVIAEGRINTPEDAAEALRRGAWAVVVGTAITRPHVITKRFAESMKKARS